MSGGGFVVERSPVFEGSLTGLAVGSRFRKTRTFAVIAPVLVLLDVALTAFGMLVTVFIAGHVSRVARIRTRGD
jgi:hypothetical protein